MKQRLNFLFVLAALLLSPMKSVAGDIAINAQNFPDPNFRYYVLYELGYGDDGVLTEYEISRIRYISVDYKEIKSLQGIEFFTALEKLWCINNQLTWLDVSKNTKLNYLNCSANQLTSLNVYFNTNLLALFFESNNLTSIDVSNITVLEHLGCARNKMTWLDLHSNPDLESLYCDHNYITTIDFSDNPKISQIDCQQNYISGQGLDDMIRSLPQVDPNKRKYEIRIIDKTFSGDHNVCTRLQARALKAKGWTPISWDNFVFTVYDGEPLMGDINVDGKVDVSDYVGVANHILGTEQEGFDEEAGDVNNDGKIDVSDYIGVASFILTGSIYGK